MARDRDIVDKYSGGGTGNWVGAPKKAEKKKAEKKTAPKPRAKPARKTDTSERTSEAKKKKSVPSSAVRGKPQNVDRTNKASKGDPVVNRSAKGGREDKQTYSGRSKTDRDPTPKRGSDADKRGIVKSMKAIGKKIAGTEKKVKNPRSVRGGRK